VTRDIVVAVDINAVERAMDGLLMAGPFESGAVGLLSAA